MDNEAIDKIPGTGGEAIDKVPGTGNEAIGIGWNVGLMSKDKGCRDSS